MKLIASMIVANNEIDRYLEPCVDSLFGYCDEIRAVVDAGCSTKTTKWLKKKKKVATLCNLRPRFYEHEGRARQRLLEWTLEGNPTHVFTIDCDEFVTDGQVLRRALEQDGEVWRMRLEEVWQARPDGIRVRVDGGWGVGSATVWRVPDRRDRRALHILDSQLACGRDPVYIRQLTSRMKTNSAGVELLHFGWTREAERQVRYQRYVDHDNGQFHARKHLDSIMWGQEQVSLVERSWPNGLDGQKDLILDYASRK